MKGTFVKSSAITNKYIDYVFAELNKNGSAKEAEDFERGVKLFGELILFYNNVNTTLNTQLANEWTDENVELNKHVPVNFVKKNISEDGLKFLDDVKDIEYSEHDTVHTKIGNVLVMHQCIEVYLMRVAELMDLYANLKLYPDKIDLKLDERKNPGFNDRIRNLKSGVSFHEREKFLTLCADFNASRNIMAHKIFNRDESDVSTECSKAHELYQKIRGILFSPFHLEGMSDEIKAKYTASCTEYNIFDAITESIRSIYQWGEFEGALVADAEEVAEDQGWLSFSEWKAQKEK